MLSRHILIIMHLSMVCARGDTLGGIGGEGGGGGGTHKLGCSQAMDFDMLCLPQGEVDCN